MSRVAGKWQIQVLLFGTFWKFFSPSIFSLSLVESADAEPVHTKGRLYLTLGKTSPAILKVIKKQNKGKPKQVEENERILNIFFRLKQNTQVLLPETVCVCVGGVHICGMNACLCLCMRVCVCV